MTSMETGTGQQANIPAQQSIQPELNLKSKSQLETIEDHCKNRAEELGCRTFTLLEQDRSAVLTIGFWILANIETAPEQKLVDALQKAVLMRSYKNRKNAD